METFSTVLFVDQSPIGYLVQRSQSRVELNPAENPSRPVAPPHLVAEHRGGKWEVNGTENQELIRQVIEEIITVQSPATFITLSAAP
ncbi:MAG TPA: hypothetical protein VEX65_12705 [Flavisolibacter sp.]|jgi:hypothetical protein|nr:hypothetical protein [Flavisolibacter sp.]